MDRRTQTGRGEGAWSMLENGEGEKFRSDENGHSKKESKGQPSI